MHYPNLEDNSSRAEPSVCSCLFGYVFVRLTGRQAEIVSDWSDFLHAFES